MLKYLLRLSKEIPHLHYITSHFSSLSLASIANPITETNTPTHFVQVTQRVKCFCIGSYIDSNISVLHFMIK